MRKSRLDNTNERIQWLHHIPSTLPARPRDSRDLLTRNALARARPPAAVMPLPPRPIERRLHSSAARNIIQIDIRTSCPPHNANIQDIHCAMRVIPRSPMSFPPSASQVRCVLCERPSARATAPSGPMLLPPSPSHSKPVLTASASARIWEID